MIVKVEKTPDSISLEVREQSSFRNQVDELVSYSKFLWSVKFEYSSDQRFTRMTVSPCSSVERLGQVYSVMKMLQEISGFKYERLYYAILAMGAKE